MLTSDDVGSSRTKTAWLRCLAAWAGVLLGLVYAGPASAATVGAATVIPGTWELYSISCPSSTVCYAAGQNLSDQDVVVALGDGLSGAVIAGSGADDVFTGIACPSELTCYAVGSETSALGQPPVGALLPINSGSPTSVSTPSGWLAITGVACPSSGACYAVGNTQSSTGAGSGMVAPLSSDGLGNPGSVSPLLSAIACPNAGTCYAVGNEPTGAVPLQPVGVVMSIAIGNLGTAITTAPGTGTLSAIACPTSSTCYAIGLDPTGGQWVVLTLTSGAPGAVNPVPDKLTLSGLACASADTCYAVGQDPSQEGVVVPIADGVPAGPIAVAGTGFLNAIACPNSGICYAVGNNQSSFLQQGVVVSITS
jgi:hypothetical protein